MAQQNAQVLFDRRTSHNSVGMHRGLQCERLPRSVFYNPSVFGRMFPTLPFYDYNDGMLERLAVKIKEDSGDQGGEPNQRIFAGFTYFGQFVDHDITFDPTSSLERQNDPEAIRNFRTPLLELDSVYGSGRKASPHLYDREQSGKLLIGVDEDEQPNDLPRNRQGVALIGDPRNDENLIVSQLHLAFLKFHNQVVDHIKANGVEGGAAVPAADDVIFAEAQRVVRWHYQWIVSHEFLRLIVGEETIREVIGGDPEELARIGGLMAQDPLGNILDRPLKHFRFTEEPYIPVEFAVGAYRFGHSQVREAYNINNNFKARLFPDGSRRPSLSMQENLTEDSKVLKSGRAVDWVRFTKVPGISPPQRFPQPGLTIDGKLSPSLFRLPGEKIASLALRNLLRGKAFALPWGERIAKKMRVDRVEIDLTDIGIPSGRTPLWYYVLKEAELRHAGQHLGPVGGRIVAEVLLGLLVGDPKSYLSQDPDWRPFLLGDNADDFTLGDLFAFAGVPTFPPPTS